MSTRAFHDVRRTPGESLREQRVLNNVAIVVIGMLLTFSVSCDKRTEEGERIRVWHFWSEPEQRRVFTGIIHDFEAQSPGIRVELTELSWSDGKAKLQTAFASGDVPDVIHLGLEWTSEFAAAGVLAPLDDSLSRIVPASLRNATGFNGSFMALPWVMNTRAMFVRNDVLRIAEQAHDDQDALTMRDLIARCMLVTPSAPAAFQAYEPHNVMKKYLPLMWSAGSRIFQTLPLHASIDTAAIIALSAYSESVRYGRMDRSRTLDEQLRRHELGIWMSGMWNLNDSAIASHYTVLPSIPPLDASSVSNGAGILSADCFCVSAASTRRASAMKLIGYLGRPQSALRFCAAIPDAGFPCYGFDASTTEASSSSDTKGLRQAILSRRHASAFYEQCKRSRALPSPPYFLDAERIFEEEVMEAMFAKKTAERAITDMRNRLITLESRTAR